MWSLRLSKQKRQSERVSMFSWFPIIRSTRVPGYLVGNYAIAPRSVWPKWSCIVCLEKWFLKQTIVSFTRRDISFTLKLYHNENIILANYRLFFLLAKKRTASGNRHIYWGKSVKRAWASVTWPSGWIFIDKLTKMYLNMFFIYIFHDFKICDIHFRLNPQNHA